MPGRTVLRVERLRNTKRVRVRSRLYAQIMSDRVDDVNF